MIAVFFAALGMAVDGVRVIGADSNHGYGQVRTHCFADLRGWG